MYFNIVCDFQTLFSNIDYKNVWNLVENIFNKLDGSFKKIRSKDISL